jgi:uncharacterized membrane protein HdeD (DUF308 family)
MFDPMTYGEALVTAVALGIGLTIRGVGNIALALTNKKNVPVADWLIVAVGLYVVARGLASI